MVLCAGAFGCYAAQGSLPGAQGQGYDLNLSYSRTTLKAVADAITQQVGIAFSYETALAGYPMENLEVSEKGATIEAILAAVFTPRGIDYRVVDKVVVLTRSTRPVPAASAAAKSEVKGVVRDAAGNPMIGVTVTIKGTLVGVSTGVDGGYAIPADGNATLLFSYIGYRPHEEVVGRRTQIDVTMQEDELVMDEVVVVGYAGWATDRFFGGRAPRTCVICMLMTALCLVGLYTLNEHTPLAVAIAILMSAGFFIYGPQALVGIAAANIATKRAAATAGGFCGLFGYGSTIVSGWGMGMLVQYTDWSVALYTLVGMALVGTAVFAAAWKAKPNGYDD